MVFVTINDNRYICTVGLGQKIGLQSPDFIKMLQVAIGSTLWCIGTPSSYSPLQLFAL